MRLSACEIPASVAPPAAHRQDDWDSSCRRLCKAGDSWSWVAAAGRGWARLQESRQPSRKKSLMGKASGSVQAHTFLELQEGAFHVLTESEGVSTYPDDLGH